MRSVHRLARLTATSVSAAVVASLLIATPAQADTRRIEDPVGDTTLSGDADYPGREGAEESVDILRVRVDYVDDTVRARIRVDDLTVADTDLSAASVRFLTDGGEDLTASLEGQGFRERARLRETDSRRIVPCDGLEARRSLRKSRYRLTLPSACLGDPESFRFGAGVGLVDIGSGNPDCCPNSYSDGARRGVIGKRIGLGTRSITAD